VFSLVIRPPGALMWPLNCIEYFHYATRPYEAETDRVYSFKFAECRRGSDAQPSPCVSSVCIDHLQCSSLWGRLRLPWYLYTTDPLNTIQFEGGKLPYYRHWAPIANGYPLEDFEALNSCFLQTIIPEVLKKICHSLSENVLFRDIIIYWKCNLFRPIPSNSLL
jgi:hypothetical protein